MTTQHYKLCSFRNLLNLILAPSLLIAPAIAQQVQFQFAYGTPGSGPGELLNPRGIAFDSDNNAYVVSIFNDRVKMFDDAGNFISEFSTVGTNHNSPRGIALSNSGHIYVSDAGSSTQVFDTVGNPLLDFGEPSEQITLFNDDKVAVTSFESENKISIFDTNGQFQFSFGPSGNGPGQLSNNAAGVTVAPNGVYYVSDFANDRIQVFDDDGDFLFMFGTSGTGDGQFMGPTYLAVDDIGRFYVPDFNNNRIQVFDPLGNFLLKFGTEGTGIGQFDGPAAVAFDRLGRLHITDGDSMSGRAQVFKIVPEPSSLLLGTAGLLGLFTRRVQRN